jgi:glutathione S-transferase
MTLELYYHPLASYCWKVLIALYENETPFEPHAIDLGNAASRAELVALWPFTKFPVLRDRARGRVVPESSIIIEYLGQHHPGSVRLLPEDPDRALEARLQDRFYDVYVHEPMQKIVGDRLRPTGRGDPDGVAQARSLLDTAYALIEGSMAARTWASGDAFTLADCAAAPALHYANRVHPLGDARKNAGAYLARLEGRPSFARVIAEARPYFHLFPG